MSLQTDMQGLIAEKMARPEAQLEVERQKSRIKDLEQKVHTLEVEKGLSAQKADDQALRPAMPTGIPDFILRDKIDRLETQLEAKNTKIAQQEEEVSALLEKVRTYREVLREATTLFGSKLDEDDDDISREDAAFQDMDRVSMAGAAAEEHESKLLKPGLSSIDTNKSTETPPVSPPKGSQGDSRAPFHTPSSQLTPAKFEDDSASKPAVPAQTNYAQVLQTPRGGPSRRRAMVNQITMPRSLITHTEVSAKKETEKQVSPEAHRQQRSQGPDRVPGRGDQRGHGDQRGRGGQKGRGGQRGRGGQGGRGGLTPNQGLKMQDPSPKRQPADYPRYAGPESTQVSVPANPEKRGELEVTHGTEVVNQPHVDSPVATSKIQIGQEILVEDKKTSNRLRGEAALFIANPMPVVVFDKPAVSDEPAELTAKQIAAYTNFGYRLPSAQNTTKADSKTVIPPVPATAQPISKIIERDSRSALQSLRPSNPPAQQLETRDFGLNNADSMPAGGLESSIPHAPITQESIATFLKPGAALDEVEKRRKSSRQGNSRTFTREPNPSAALSQDLRKRRVSFDEAEESSKRRRVGPPSPSQPVRGPAIAASTGVPESKTEEPDVATEGNPSASALVDAGAPVLTPRSPFRWADMRTPKNPFLCIIQADNSSLIGSFAKDTEEWAFSLGLDAGRRRIPTMNMRFFSNGIEGPEYSQTGWCLGDYIEGDWMVTNFRVHRVADYPDDGEICHPNVLAACNTDEEKARLICISLEAWPKILGHFNPKDRPEIRKPDVKKLFGAVFTGRHPYELRIWFRAPYNLERFEKQCLSFFTRYFEQRRPPHEDLYDADDVCFEDHLKAQEEASSTSARGLMRCRSSMSLNDAFR